MRPAQRKASGFGVGGGGGLSGTPQLKGIVPVGGGLGVPLQTKSLGPLGEGVRGPGCHWGRSVWTTALHRRGWGLGLVPAKRIYQTARWANRLIQWC